MSTLSLNFYGSFSCKIAYDVSIFSIFCGQNNFRLRWPWLYLWQIEIEKNLRQRAYWKKPKCNLWSDYFQLSKINFTFNLLETRSLETIYLLKPQSYYGNKEFAKMKKSNRMKIHIHRIVKFQCEISLPTI